MPSGKLVQAEPSRVVARDRVRQQDAGEPDRAEGRIGADGGGGDLQPDVPAATAASVLRRQQGCQIDYAGDLIPNKRENELSDLQICPSFGIQLILVPDLGDNIPVID